MRNPICLFLLLSCCLHGLRAQNVFSVQGTQTLLNGEPFQVMGLRCSNALLSDETTSELISHLDEYRSYGLNTVSVFFLGSRYSNIYGFELDGSLSETHAARMGRIIEACDRRGMVVLVGLLYWGAQMSAEENAHYASWTQAQVNEAMRNTVRWLKAHNYRNAFIDPDNEGMAERGAGFDVAEMICAGKEENPDMVIAYNGKSYPPPCADLPIHFAWKVRSMPYIETEGTPRQYWGEYSKERGLDHYINVGIYTPGKKAQQLAETLRLLNEGHGYLFASTWLQNVPPNYAPGGDGSPCGPGMRWWLEAVKAWREEKD